MSNFDHEKNETVLNEMKIFFFENCFLLESVSICQVREQISCQFLPPGGSMSLGYALQCLFSENLLITQQPLKLDKK